MNDHSQIDTIVDVVTRHLGPGSPTLEQSLRILAQAQELLLEENATPLIVLYAALLRGLDPQEARGILKGLDLDPALGERIGRIVTGVDSATREARIVADASLLAALAKTGDLDETTPEQIASRLTTPSGRRHARRLLQATWP